MDHGVAGHDTRVGEGWNCEGVGAHCVIFPVFSLLPDGVSDYLQSIGFSALTQADALEGAVKD